MIFISGVHGVGKSYFCDMVKAATGIESYSASTLITQKKQSQNPSAVLQGTPRTVWRWSASYSNWTFRSISRRKT